ncbi:MAG: hypothetical protein H7Y86_00430 [Rhizobacter sp.]|nr:hypothetical protein [Ferruginibacter sp.]
MSLMTALLFGQTTKQELIVLAGQGLVINADTIFLGQTPTQVIAKLDTINNKFDAFYVNGIADGVIRFYDSTKKLIRSVDSFWMTRTCSMTYREAIKFKFNSERGDSLLLTNIVVNYPLTASAKMVTIRSKKRTIFKYFGRVKGSYNCGDGAWCFCYPKQGISFEVEPFKELPDIELHNKVIGIETYKSQVRQ